MSDLAEIGKKLANRESLERELHLKQLQINRLLNITQAINNNVSAADLFNMYQSFLSWEMDLKKMVLYFREDTHWDVKASFGVDEEFLILDVTDKLRDYSQINQIDESEHPLLKHFDVVIPVRHKKIPLAYLFVGGFAEDEDMYNKVQLITAITNVIAVAIENKRLFKRQLEQEGLKREMALGKEMQEMLIPSTLPKGNGYEFASIYRPKLTIGGDYFDYIDFKDGEFAFCIGDISGKGIAAALLMSNFQANFQSLISQRAPLDQFIQALNTSVNRITLGDKFITFFVGKYDQKTQILRYVNAGHNPPALAIDGKVVLLNKGCTFLGSFDHIEQIEIGEVKIDNEAMLLMYTDGLTDIKSPDGEFVDEDFGKEFVRRNYKLSAEAFNDKLLQILENFGGTDIFPDDFTVLTCKIY